MKSAFMLEISGLHKRFDGVVAVDDLVFNVGASELVGLIGPNGAGKTTVFNLVSGVLKPDRGQVTFNQQDITNKSAHLIASLGLTRTFQRRLMPEGCVCNVSVMGEGQLEIMTAAILNGDHVRVGTEDLPFDHSGKLVDTPALVHEAAEMARALGRPLATVEQARKMIGL